MKSILSYFLLFIYYDFSFFNFASILCFYWIIFSLAALFPFTNLKVIYSLYICIYTHIYVCMCVDI